MSSTSVPQPINTPTSADKAQLHAGESTNLRHDHPPHHRETLRERFEKLEEDLKETTNQAVQDGHDDVNQTTASYLEKALSLADSGLSAAQTYVGAGKERLQAPHQGNQGDRSTHPQAHDSSGSKSEPGFTASLAATAASALNAAGSYLGLAQQKIHEQQGHPNYHHNPHTAVTSPTKPIGQALSDNVTASQAAVQPHVDAAYGAAKPHVDAAQELAQPHIDAAKEAAQPHTDSAKAAAQPHVDVATTAAQPHIDDASQTISSAAESAKQAWNSDKPLTQQAQEVAQPHVDAAKDAWYGDKPITQHVQEAAQPALESGKSLLPQGQDPVPSYTSKTATAEVPSNPILERAGDTHPSVEASKPGPEYPLRAGSGSIPARAAEDSRNAAVDSVASTKSVNV